MSVLSASRVRVRVRDWSFKDERALNNLRATIGSQKFSALYQGSPVPDDGTIFRREWFGRTYRELPYPIREHDIVSPWQAVDMSDKVGRPPLTFVAALDAASSVRIGADYSAIVVWCTDGDKFYLADAFRDRLEYRNLRRVVQQVHWKWKPAYFVVEDSSSGSALISDLKRFAGFPVVGVKATRSKEQRAELVTPLFEAGRCVFPTRELLPSVDDFIAS